MRTLVFIELFFALSLALFGHVLTMVRARDEATTFPAVEALVLENGSVYLSEKALGVIFGAHLKSEGENLVILCKDIMCLPFYKDDPHHTVVERKGKPLLLASKVGEAFGYVRFAYDRSANEMTFFKTPEPKENVPQPVAMPDFAIPNMAKETVSLSQYKGKKVIILVWAPWDKSRESLARWSIAASEFAEKGAVFFLAAQTIEGRERLEPYLTPLKPRPVCLMDSGFLFTLAFNLTELPALLAVDEMGNLIWGPVNPEPKFDEISAALSGWLGGKTDTVITTAGPSVKTIEPTSSRIETSQRMELSQALWISGKKSEAIEQFSQALQKIGDSAILENQLRALKEPEKFYPTPTPAPVPAKQ